MERKGRKGRQERQYFLSGFRGPLRSSAATRHDGFASFLTPAPLASLPGTPIA
jgi:hypothetical protein